MSGVRSVEPMLPVEQRGNTYIELIQTLFPGLNSACSRRGGTTQKPSDLRSPERESA